MPHVDSDQFASVAKKRVASLPHQGEFVLHPHPPASPEKSETHEKIKEAISHHSTHEQTQPRVQEQLRPYDGSHRNAYLPELEIPSHSVKVPAKSDTQHHPDVVHRHEMTTGEKVNFIVMRTIGNFLLFFSLYGVAATFGPALYYEGQYRVAQARGIEYTVQDPNAVAVPVGESSVSPTPIPTIAPESPGFGSVMAGSSEQVLVPPDTEFSVVIPKIGATSKVYPNVDPLDENDFLTKLQTGVAHAKGTVFPGMQGNTYLFAHSTDNFWNVGRYNAVFYLLKELQPGDEVIVFFEGKRHNYKVERTEVRDADDVELLTKSQQPGKEQLIMQTCWPPGTTWKRLFVIATPQ